LLADNKDEIKNKVLAIVKDKAYVPAKMKEMAFLLDVDKKNFEFKSALNELLDEGEISLTRNRKIILPKALNLYKGTFTSNARGFGFVTVEDSEGKDIFIPADYINGAMNKDIVLAKVHFMDYGKKPEGEIIKIIKKSKVFVVGTFEKREGFGFVRPDDEKIPHDIFITKANSKNAVTGHKVGVTIIKRADKNYKPEGKVVEILGHKNDPGVDILSIIKQLEIPIEFPEEIYDEIENIKDTVDESETANRTDLRNIQTVTIDGEDAKDLDDAISLEVLENGNYKLGVHIADVTHYVKENSPLDTEALNRGTSVYLVDRVIPMLPHKLSNGICSLNPNVDRLALSCIMEINKNGDIVAHEILETIININKRMSYTAVSSVLEDEASPHLEDYEKFMPMLQDMATLSKILKAKRLKRGSLEFDFPESKVILDSEGKTIDVKIYERNFATNIIEEFMLVSNETVAEVFFWLEIPFVFRTHEEPDSEKITKLNNFISRFGYFLKGSSNHTKSLQSLLSKLKGTKEETVINRIILRSLKQARYTPENDGHFGLAAKYYCHFTSPIRRYPDLQIHRIIKEHVNGKMNAQRIEHYKNIINEVCNSSSSKERLAENAERETSNYKKVEYMSDKVGEVFEAVISGVTGWGIYVELPNTIEGLVSVSSMRDDYYVFDEERFVLVGERFGRVYALGDKVTVELVRANIDARKLDFIFA